MCAREGAAGQMRMIAPFVEECNLPRLEAPPRPALCLPSVRIHICIIIHQCADFEAHKKDCALVRFFFSSPYGPCFCFWRFVLLVKHDSCRPFSLFFYQCTSSRGRGRSPDCHLLFLYHYLVSGAARRGSLHHSTLSPEQPPHNKQTTVQTHHCRASPSNGPPTNAKYTLAQSS